MQQKKLIKCERERLIIWKMPFKQKYRYLGIYSECAFAPLKYIINTLYIQDGVISVETVFPMKRKEIVFRTVLTH